jgi:hypothetical protein
MRALGRATTQRADDDWTACGLGNLADPIIKHLKRSPDDRRNFNCTDNALR